MKINWIWKIKLDHSLHPSSNNSPSALRLLSKYTCRARHLHRGQSMWSNIVDSLHKFVSNFDIRRPIRHWSTNPRKRSLPNVYCSDHDLHLPCPSAHRHSKVPETSYRSLNWWNYFWNPDNSSRIHRRDQILIAISASLDRLRSSILVICKMMIHLISLMTI